MLTLRDLWYVAMCLPLYVVSRGKVVLTTRLSIDDDGHCKGDEDGKFSLAKANNTSVLPSSCGVKKILIVSLSTNCNQEIIFFLI